MSRFWIRGIVIRAFSTGESSRILTIFSAQAGKIKCIARGAKKFQKKSGGPPGLFSLIDCQIYARENSELGTLSGYDAIHDYGFIAAEPEKFGYASAICEIIDKGTQINQPISGLFELLIDFLSVAGKSPPEVMKILFYCFFLKYLAILGYNPELNVCSVCGKENRGRSAYYLPKVGGIICTKDLAKDEKAPRLSAAALAALKSMAGLPLEKITDMKLDADTSRECEQFLFSFADYHIGLRPNLKSLRFLAQL